MLIYRIAIWLYGISIQIVGLWNLKARKWVNGRKAQNLDALEVSDQSTFRLWMHVASLGEFEQGRLLLEAIKTQYPDTHITVSFFSPSGYELVNAPFIDQKLYLPLDTRSNAKAFLEYLDPDLIVFVKYEFWYHHLDEALNRKIPTIFISALFRKNQWFFKPVFGKMMKMLKEMNILFVQDGESEKLLKAKGFENMIIAGDNRIDRVLAITQGEFDFSRIQSYFATPFDLICGSIWPEDADILIPFIQQRGIKAIIAPHEMNPKFLHRLSTAFGKKAISFSKLDNYSAKDKPEILILDTIGLLSKIYRLGKMAYIGGGFGPGIHNTLEPAAYGIPVIFGPNYHKFTEAKTFIQIEAARSVTNLNEMTDAFVQFLNPDNQFFIKKELDQYFKGNQGGTRRIMKYLEDNALIT